jgi:hypothetical protein
MPMTLNSKTNACFAFFQYSIKSISHALKFYFQVIFIKKVPNTWPVAHKYRTCSFTVQREPFKIRELLPY